MVPGDFFGEPGTTVPFSMYVQHNMTAGIKATQVLFDKTVFTSLSLAEKSKEINGLNYQKAREDIIYDIADLYFLIKSTEEQKEILKENIDRLNQLTNITEARYKAGFVQQVDVERVRIDVANLQTEYDNLDILHSHQLDLLKYTMGINPEDTNENIVLTDSLQGNLIFAPDSSADINNRYEVKLLSKQMEYAKLNKKVITAEYYPTLSIYGQHYYTSENEEFDFFSSDISEKWHGADVIGLTLSVPIFDGFSKSTRRNQAEIDYKLAASDYEFTRRSLNVEYRHALRAYNNSSRTESRQEDNVNLAEEVYDQTLLQYKEGVVSLSDLLEIENSLNDARLNLTNAVHQLRTAELDILKASGRLKTILNQ